MNTILIMILVSKCLSVTLNLPFNEIDIYFFKTETVGVKNDPILEEYGLARGYIMYEANDNNLITKVTYLGNVIFHDEEMKKPLFRRIVSYGDMGNGLVLSIYSGIKKLDLESFYYISKAIVYNLMEAKEVFNLRKQPYNNELERPSLKTLCKELTTLKPVNYELGETNTDTKVPVRMGEKEIEHELERIFKAKMDIIILLIYGVVNSICIGLHLPNNDRESPIFKIVQDIEYSNTPFHPVSLIHFTITYESKTNELIDEVYYYGAQIFHDQGHDPPPDRRIVTYTLTGTKIIISIHPEEIDTSVDTNYFEAQYFIDHEGVYDIAHNVPSGIQIMNNNPNAVKEHELLAFLTKKSIEDEMFPMFPKFSFIDFIASKLFSRFKRATSNDVVYKYETANDLEEDYQLRGNADEEGALVEVNGENGNNNNEQHHPPQNN